MVCAYDQAKDTIKAGVWRRGRRAVIVICFLAAVLLLILCWPRLTISSRGLEVKYSPRNVVAPQRQGQTLVSVPRILPREPEHREGDGRESSRSDIDRSPAMRASPSLLLPASGARDISVSFERAEGLCYLGSSAERNSSRSNRWTHREYELTFEVRNRLGSVVATITWDVSFFLCDGYVANVYPGLVGTWDAAGWAGDLTVRTLLDGGLSADTCLPSTAVSEAPEKKTTGRLLLEATFGARSLLAEQRWTTVWEITATGEMIRRQ